MSRTGYHDIAFANPDSVKPTWVWFTDKITELCDEIRKYDDIKSEDSVYISVALRLYLDRKKKQYEVEQRCKDA